MRKRLQTILFILSCAIFILSCKKQEVPATVNARLLKIITSGVDSLGDDCSSCLYYQLFRYDLNGKLVSITDSNVNWMQMYIGPSPYRLFAGIKVDKGIRLLFEYDTQGNLIKAGRDSFIYNNQKQLTARMQRAFNDTSDYFVSHKYIYDAQGRLVADTGFIRRNYFEPAILYGYKLFNYDGSGNMNRAESVDLWPPGSAQHNTSNAMYDSKVSPYKSQGLLFYLVYNDAVLLSPQNPTNPGYIYDYYDNGLLKKVTYQNYKQEFVYE